MQVINITSIRRHLSNFLTVFACVAVIVSPVSAYSIEDLGLGLSAVGFALFGLAILWGAAKIIAAGGDTTLAEEGENVLKNAVIGLILIAIATTLSGILSGNVTIEPLRIIPP